MELRALIETYSDEHLDPLLALFGSYFPAGDRLRTPAYSRWLYAANPFGEARMVFVPAEEGWAAFMAMIPVQLARSSEALLAYFVVNVLVHPAYQGRNLFSRMIRAANESVVAEGSALLGHPNDLALKAWQRARMHFHDPLRPCMAMPSFRRHGIRVRVAKLAADLRTAAPALERIVAVADGWRVHATPEYLDWRYLQHPTNRYRVQLIARRDEVLGVQVTKRARGPVAMFIDQFVPPELEHAATRRLPFPTVCFLPQARIAALGGAASALPWKKELPFFFTRPAAALQAASVVRLGLSASDF